MPKAEGDAVKAGDLLVRFDIPTLASDVAAKRASVAQASARARSRDGEFQSPVVAPRAGRRRAARSRRREAAAGRGRRGSSNRPRARSTPPIALAERTVVRATFSGVVAKRFHNPGDFVEAGGQRSRAERHQPGAAAGRRVGAGRPTCRAWSSDTPPRFAQPGREDDRAARVTDEGRSSRSGRRDRPTCGWRSRRRPRSPPAPSCEVEIVGEEHTKAVVIPAAAVVSEDGEVFVMVAGADNKAHKYPVAIGCRRATLVEITSGLKAGDRVIVRGQDGLPEGAAITVQDK